MDGKTSELLIQIQRAFGCEYLSDLHRYHLLLSEARIDAILDIPLEFYSCEEWSAAVSYILDKEFHCATVEEAREKIIKFSIKK